MGSRKREGMGAFPYIPQESGAELLGLLFWAWIHPTTRRKEPLGVLDRAHERLLGYGQESSFRAWYG